MFTFSLVTINILNDLSVWEQRDKLCDFILVNGHFFWKPGVSEDRQALLLDFLDTQPVNQSVVVCGDFNGMPGTPAIDRMYQYFDSANFAVHNQEPEYTCSTPLPKPTLIKLRSIMMWMLGMRPKPDPTLRGTLDFIFVDPRLQTQDSSVVLNLPADNNLKIYPSDHFGLYASIKINA